MSRILAVAFLAWLLPAAPAAQSTRARQAEPPGRDKDAPIPKAYLPPAGMCRIWVDNVPAARQPAPTDCPTAIRNKPPNARVVFPASRDGRGVEPRQLTPRRAPPDTTGKRKPPT